MTMSHELDVPVRTYLTFAVYRALQQLADERETTVSVLVAIAARQAVTPRPGKRRYVRMTPDLFHRLCELSKTDLSTHQIAAELGVSYSTVNNHIQRARSKK